MIWRCGPEKNQDQDVAKAAALRLLERLGPGLKFTAQLVAVFLGLCQLLADLLDGFTQVTIEALNFTGISGVGFNGKAVTGIATPLAVVWGGFIGPFGAANWRSFITSFVVSSQ